MNNSTDPTPDMKDTHTPPYHNPTFIWALGMHGTPEGIQGWWEWKQTQTEKTKSATRDFVDDVYRRNQPYYDELQAKLEQTLRLAS